MNNTNVLPGSPDGAESRLLSLGIALPEPPGALGTYAMSTTSGSLMFLTGMLPIKDHAAVFRGRLGAEIDLEQGRMAARLAALNALAVMRHELGSLDRVARILRLGVFVATASAFREHPQVADGASLVIRDVFGAESNPCRLVIGVANLPLDTPVELELIAELSDTLARGHTRPATKELS